MTQFSLSMHEGLPPDVEAQLARVHDLTPAERARVAAVLRDDLHACAAYIPARLVRAQLANPLPGRVGGAWWQGSIVFADLSGFTALSEKWRARGKQGAEEVSALVNQLFDALVAEVFVHQGMLLKFGGDALTAFFDADDLGDAHASAATSAALAMQRCMQAFAARERAGLFPLALRVGVHSGRVFAAEVGDTSHIELIVTGAEVNRVALAQEIAAPGEVVVSDHTAALLEGAKLEPRAAGFQCIHSLLYFRLPPAPPVLVQRDGPADLHTLEQLVQQIAALRPYLMHRLPQRFLHTAVDALGEFRPVSVLFANFHDVSALLAQLGDDPHIAARVLNAYYQRAQTVIHRYEGTVNKVDMAPHGDKLMALFGAPIAHEDDPLRAVRCALDLQDALVAANEEIARLVADDTATHGQRDLLTTPEHSTISQKIGLSTGTMFAGRVGGNGRYEYTVMGPAVNLAARLMAAAADNTVLVSPVLRATVARHVELVDQPPLYLKGIDNPIVPARVHRMRLEERPPAFAESLSRAPLVGRASELALLTDLARTAFGGSGCVLALIGEAGIGKTRLIEDGLHHLIMQSIQPDSHTPPFSTLVVDAQSYDQSTPYAVMRELLCQLLRIDARDINVAMYPTVAARVAALVPPLARFTPLLGDMLGVLFADTPLTGALPLAQRHDRAQELAVALLGAAAREQPLLVIIDDLYWADASSLQVLSALASKAADLPILLLLSYRSDARLLEPWRDLAHCTTLHLGELSPDGTLALLQALLGAAPPLGLTTLVEKAQGNPFFVEEVVRSLIESGTLRRSGTGWDLAEESHDVVVPDSIEGVIMARLDRLDDRNREVLHVASVIGRRFPFALLTSIVQPDATITEQLQRLAESDLILVEENEREHVYLFRHALTRDVAYEAILYARRRELHRRVAHAIEQHAEHREDQALLARHYLLAEDWQPAFRYHLAAGTHAQQRYAHREALNLFHGALAIAPHLDEENASAQAVAELHERCGDVRVLLGEYDLAHEAYVAALGLVAPSQLALNEQHVRLYRLLATIEERRSNYDAAFEWLEYGMAQARNPARAEVARSHLLGAGIYFRQGEYARALEWVRMGLTSAERLGNRTDQAHAFKLMGNVWREQGEFDQSIGALEQARTLFEQMNSGTGLSDVLNDLGMLYLHVGRWQDTVTCYEQSLAISENIGDVQAMARTSNNLAVVLVGRGELQRAGELYKYSSEQFSRIGSVLGVALTSYNRGEVLLLQGAPAIALPLFQASIATFERIKARNFLPEVLRLAAEALLLLDNAAQARDYAQQSLGSATDLGMSVDAAVALRVLGQIALAQGDLATAESTFAQSHAALEQVDNSYELGKVLYWQAQLARTAASPAQAATLAQQAETIFAQLDAQRDLALVRAFVLEEPGEDPRDISSV